MDLNHFCNYGLLESLALSWEMLFNWNFCWFSKKKQGTLLRSFWRNTKISLIYFNVVLAMFFDFKSSISVDYFYRSWFEKILKNLMNTPKMKKASIATDPRHDTFIRKVVISFSKLPFFRSKKKNNAKFKICSFLPWTSNWKYEIGMKQQRENLEATIK